MRITIDITEAEERSATIRPETGSVLVAGSAGAEGRLRKMAAHHLKRSWSPSALSPPLGREEGPRNALALTPADRRLGWWMLSVGVPTEPPDTGDRGGGSGPSGRPERES